MWVICMIKKQETMILSEYAGIYDLVVPKDNMLRKINELIDFSFVYDELLDKYCFLLFYHTHHPHYFIS